MTTTTSHPAANFPTEPFWDYDMVDWGRTSSRTDTPDLIEAFDDAAGWASDETLTEEYQQSVLAQPDVAEGLKVALAELADTER